jgi:hypothetical protein
MCPEPISTYTGVKLPKLIAAIAVSADAAFVVYKILRNDILTFTYPFAVMANVEHAAEARAAIRVYLGRTVSDETFDESARLMRAHNDNSLIGLRDGALQLLPGFCSWNVNTTLLFQAQDFPGFKMVFGSMGYKLGSKIWWEFGHPTYTTTKQFHLHDTGSGFDGHFWMANDVTGEVADISFPSYREVSNMRCQKAKVKFSYLMKESNDFKWFIASPVVWRKFGVVHCAAPSDIQALVAEEFSSGDWAKENFGAEGKKHAAAFKKFPVLRVVQKI